VQEEGVHQLVEVEEELMELRLEVAGVGEWMKHRLLEEEEEAEVEVEEGLRMVG
jgi:hypothetical protein